jgi:Fe(3+) dicitrate transport protein
MADCGDPSKQEGIDSGLECAQLEQITIFGTGLTDRDFVVDGLRRYGASLFDEIHVKHDQIVLNWRLETQDGLGMTITGYDNNTKRAWYKTEGMDFDGSVDPLGGLSAGDLQAILDGADTAEGSIGLRNNAREYCCAVSR